jgi:hypothetical protein
MARTLPGGAGERTVLGGAHINVYAKLEIKDSDGAWRDMTNLSGFDWLDRWRVEETIDDPIGKATFTLRREIGALSLAPLVQASALNKNGALAYQPLVNPGRLCRFSVATVGNGVSAAGNYHEIFQGYITDVDPASPDDGITVKALDLGVVLQNAWIEAIANYGSGVGVAVETVMQAVINTTITVGPPTLVTPASPGWLITTYAQDQVSVLQAIRDLALQIGWDLRYMYQAATDTPELRFYQPPRAQVVPDWTFAAAEYLRIDSGKLSDADIRNAAKISYVDVNGNVQSVVRLNSGSITKYGRRYMEINESASSNIDTLAEAQAMGDAAVSDLGTPLQEHEIETLLFWPLQLNDLCRFTANGVQYDTDQDLAAVAFVHEGQGGDGRTTISCRGKPAGAYRDWIRKGRSTGGGDSGGDGGPQAPPPVANILFVKRTRAFETVRFIGAIIDPGMGPLLWQWKIGNAAYSALSSAALPVDQVIVRGPHDIKTVYLRVVQADGQYMEVNYAVPGYANDNASIPQENQTRVGNGGVPTGRAAAIHTQTLFDSAGLAGLVDPVLKRVGSTLQANDGVAGIESQRGSNTNATRKGAGLGARGIVGDGRDRSGNGGTDTPRGRIETDPFFSRDGVTPYYDPDLGRLLTALYGPNGLLPMDRLEHSGGMATVGHRHSTQKSDPLTTSAGPSTATISIAAHDVQFGFGVRSYNSGSVSGLPLSQDCFVYGIDGSFAGGAISYGVPTPNSQAESMSALDRYFVGTIRTPAANGSSSGSTHRGGGADPL